MEKDNKFLSEFKRTLGKRIATTPNAYENNSWSYHRVSRVKDYSLEEVKKIVPIAEKLGKPIFANFLAAFKQLSCFLV